MSKPTHEQVAAITAQLTDAGKLIEAGWMGYRLLVVPDGAGQAQVDDTRMAFFGGAQHLWSSILSILTPGAEPTDADLRRMSLIAGELAAFEKVIRAKAEAFEQATKAEGL